MVRVFSCTGAVAPRSTNTCIQCLTCRRVQTGVTVCATSSLVVPARWILPAVPTPKTAVARNGPSGFQALCDGSVPPHDTVAATAPSCSLYVEFHARSYLPHHFTRAPTLVIALALIYARASSTYRPPQYSSPNLAAADPKCSEGYDNCFTLGVLLLHDRYHSKNRGATPRARPAPRQSLSLNVVARRQGQPWTLSQTVSMSGTTG